MYTELEYIVTMGYSLAETTCHTCDHSSENDFKSIKNKFKKKTSNVTSQNIVKIDLAGFLMRPSFTQIGILEFLSVLCDNGLRRKRLFVLQIDQHNSI